MRLVGVLLSGRDAIDDEVTYVTSNVAPIAP